MTPKESKNSEIVFAYLFRGSLGTTHSLSRSLIVLQRLCSILNISMNSNGNEFGVVFLVMWGGSFVVTVNTKLLGGKISFFQCVCVLGYCVFPIVLGAAIVAILKMFSISFILLKLIIAALALIWASLGIYLLNQAPSHS